MFVSTALDRGTASPFCESLISHTFIMGIILPILRCRAGFFSTKAGMGQALSLFFFFVFFFEAACVRVYFPPPNEFPPNLSFLFCFCESFLSFQLRVLFYSTKIKISIRKKPSQNWRAIPDLVKKPGLDILNWLHVCMISLRLISQKIEP